MTQTPRLGRRFTAPNKEIDPASVSALRPDHPALAEGRTIFPSTRADPRHHLVLVSGKEQRKIGDRIVKGPWAGLRVYCVTLEERATCPRSCHHWSGCYGNTMPFSRRHSADPITLTKAIYFEVDYLSRKHPRGFAVRLHILGDFMSADYAKFWGLMLRNYPGLHLFGFTARQPGTEIGREVDNLNHAHPTRCRIRFSVPVPTGRAGESAPILDLDAPRAAGAIQCPAQTHPGRSCGSCALCWSDAAWAKPILFALHGMSGGRKPDAAVLGRLRVAEPTRSWPRERIAAFARAWADYNKTTKDIAAEFGIVASFVGVKRKEFGLPDRPHGRRSRTSWQRFTMALPLITDPAEIIGRPSPGATQAHHHPSNH